MGSQDNTAYVEADPALHALWRLFRSLVVLASTHEPPGPRRLDSRATRRAKQAAIDESPYARVAAARQRVVWTLVVLAVLVRIAVLINQAEPMSTNDVLGFAALGAIVLVVGWFYGRDLRAESRQVAVRESAAVGHAMSRLASALAQLRDEHVSGAQLAGSVRGAPDPQALDNDVLLWIEAIRRACAKGSEWTSYLDQLESEYNHAMKGFGGHPAVR